MLTATDMLKEMDLVAEVPRFDPEKTWDGSEEPLSLVDATDHIGRLTRRAESAEAEAHDRRLEVDRLRATLASANERADRTETDNEALRLELEAANELNDRLQRALERSTEEAIALRRALEDEQRLRVEAERTRDTVAAKLELATMHLDASKEAHKGALDGRSRAEASELLYENVLDRCADYLQGAAPVMAIPQHEVDRAKRAGVETRYAVAYHKAIMAALVAAKEADARARSCVQQGLAGASDSDLMTEVERRAISEIRGA